MAYFHEKFPKSKGGKKRRVMRRVCGETIDEILSVARRWPEATTINLPPRSADAWKSKSLPMLHVDVERRDILEELKSAEVSQEHIRVMTMQLREDWFRTRCERYMTKEVERFFRNEVRGKVILLLRSGSWVDQPENLGLQNWNNRVEKLDLGRRSDLNFSSDPIPIDQVQNYDPDYKPSHLATQRFGPKDKVIHEDSTPDFLAMYRDGTQEVRRELWSSRPWQQYAFREYGEPE